MRRFHFTLVTSVILSLAALLIGTFLSNVGLAARIAFDDFDDRDLDYNGLGTWEPIFGAELDVSSGDLVLSAPACCRGVAFSEPISGDVSIRTRALVHSGLIGVGTKFDPGSGGDDYEGYFVGLYPDGMLEVATHIDGVISHSTATVASAAGNGHDVILQMDIVGNRLETWYWEAEGPPPTSPQLSIELSETLDTGTAGVYVGTSGVDSRATIRFIQIADAPIPIPEPGSVVLLLCGVAVAGLLRRQMVFPA
jgi:hypothetical protein